MADVYGGTGVKIARLPGVQPELEAAAQKILARARGGASPHVETGHYISSLGVRSIPGKSGVIDREVYNDDQAAVFIEYGHATRDGGWVPGQRILLNALYG